MSRIPSLNTRAALGEITHTFNTAREDVVKPSALTNRSNTARGLTSNLARRRAQKTILPSAQRRIDSELSLKNVDEAVTFIDDLNLANIPDIDSQDAHDPQVVFEYIDDIYKFLRKNELEKRFNHKYMKDQVDINERMRTILVDWLIDVHLKFKLLPETLFLTTNIIDRFLNHKQVARQKFQLVGVTAMLIASKYEEIYAPEVRDFVYITDRAYSKDEILKMERLILATLDFRLTVPTHYTFVKRFIKAAGVGSSSKVSSSTSKKMELLFCYILELAQPHTNYLKYLPSHIDAAALWLARKVLTGDSDWHQVLTKYTQYDDEQLMPCVRELAQLMRNASTAEQKAAYRKYSSARFGEVARLPVPSNL
uniref:Cyclin N-terminal domain-containing protein n=1 Tax=Palpitomonas bilix TaxID=652834 RepID=A0A7S3GGS5_9EUKA|mmetsp:Transcript_48591/g.126077  ORF Transcript_48591/g.126077 Transcript_48591/m.126077 type:complete len:367 (+) Transcript_48591:128-1228(+)